MYKAGWCCIHVLILVWLGGMGVELVCCGSDMFGIEAIYNDRVFFKAEGQPLYESEPLDSPKVIITFINGIYHSEEDWRRIAKQIEDTFECPVLPHYNPSTGWWVGDATRAGSDLLRMPTDSRTALSLVAHLREALLTVGPRGRVLHIAHSGGAIITYIAAKYHLTAEERSRIDVITFGAGRSLTRKYFPSNVVNYYARNDPCLIVDRRGNKLTKRLRSLSGYSEDASGIKSFYSMKGPAQAHEIDPIYGDERFGDELLYNVSQALCKQPQLAWTNLHILESKSTMLDAAQSCIWEEVNYVKHNTTFVYMKALVRQPVRDHAMEGPTYKLGLAREAVRFRRRREEMLTEWEADELKIDWPRIVRKMAANATGMHHFWSRSKHAIMTAVLGSHGDDGVGKLEIQREMMELATTQERARDLTELVVRKASPQSITSTLRGIMTGLKAFSSGTNGARDEKMSRQNYRDKSVTNSGVSLLIHEPLCAESLAQDELPSQVVDGINWTRAGTEGGSEFSRHESSEKLDESADRSGIYDTTPSHLPNDHDTSVASIEEPADSKDVQIPLDSGSDRVSGTDDASTRPSIGRGAFNVIRGYLFKVVNKWGPVACEKGPDHVDDGNYRPILVEDQNGAGDPTTAASDFTYE